ncbi:MAG: FtsW/RodA/SpoVE family cell cycle protein [Clostridia bacterium]|nr:FtsW/RodA/SpoVE family cell cycle protein [Clostridia bacterium]
MSPLRGHISFKSLLGSVDPVVLFCMLTLSCMSLLTVIGGAETFGQRRLIMQLAMNAAGIVATFLIANLDYREVVDKFGFGFFLLSAGFLCLVFVPFLGVNEGTNLSWIDLGPVSVQPSEFVKASFTLTFAKHLHTVRDRINHPKTLLGLALHAGVIVGLILISGDLGVALVYMGIILIMLFGAGLSLWYFLGASFLGVIVFPILWPHLNTYQQNRILFGFQPEKDPLGVGMHALQGRDTVIRGGMWGEGMFGGTAYKKLYAADTDFIFSTYCEKFGFVGAILLILVMLVFVWRLITLARICRKDCGGYICLGIAAMIVVQTVENIGMCLGMLPVVGITLPFMSCGGSSTLAIYITLGMVHSIYNHHVRYYYENGKR